MSPLLLTLLAFLAGVLVVAGAYSVLADLYFRDRSRVSQRIDEEFRKRQRDHARKSSLFGDLTALAAEGGGPEEQPSLRRRFEAMIEQSGLNLEPRRLLTIMAGCALGLGGLVGLLRQSVVLGVVIAAIGGAVPLLYVNFKRKARLAKLLSQLPDALELMSRVIRAGQTMSQAIQAVADEFDLPLSAEFSYCYEQQNLGLPADASFRDLARRTGLLEVKIFVLALVVQQQLGGNLAELLDNLAGVIRERFRLRGKIQAMTAEGRMQAAVLLGLPPALLVIIGLIKPGYVQVLFDHSYLLIGVFVSELIGALFIRKIVNFDF